MILKYNVFTLLWAVVILLLTLLAGGASSNIKAISLDKLIHASMFAMQCLLLIVGLKKQQSSPYLKFNALKVAVLATTLYGVIVECLQAVIPGRSFEWQDMVANMVGAFIGLGLFFLIYKVKIA